MIGKSPVHSGMTLTVAAAISDVELSFMWQDIGHDGYLFGGLGGGALGGTWFGTGGRLSLLFVMVSPFDGCFCGVGTSDTTIIAGCRHLRGSGREAGPHLTPVTFWGRFRLV